MCVCKGICPNAYIELSVYVSACVGLRMYCKCVGFFSSHLDGCWVYVSVHTSCPASPLLPSLWQIPAEPNLMVCSLSWGLLCKCVTLFIFSLPLWVLTTIGLFSFLLSLLETNIAIVIHISFAYALLLVIGVNLRMFAPFICLFLFIYFDWYAYTMHWLSCVSDKCLGAYM